MDTLQNLLQRLGIADKEATVYTTLLRLGSGTVRAVAEASGINRGTTFECLQSLRAKGLLAYYHQSAHQHFVAEPPEKLLELVEDSIRSATQLRDEALQMLPQLRSFAEESRRKPVVKFYEGKRGVKTVLRDVLSTVEKQQKKEYAVYSSADIRKYLYESYPSFTEERIERDIHVRVLAAGSGGELHGLDERKWLPGTSGAPTYIIVYGHRTAMISVTSAKLPIAVVIEDEGIAETQQKIFDALWQLLPS